MTVLLDISYIGTAYAGWQVQPNAPTVQAAMCDAVERLLGVRCPVTGCSRTDSGVHAHSFCCTVSELPEGLFDTDGQDPARALVGATGGYIGAACDDRAGRLSSPVRLPRQGVCLSDI